MNGLSYRIGYTQGRRWALKLDPVKRERVLASEMLRSVLEGDMEVGWLDAVYDVQSLYLNDFSRYTVALREVTK